MIAKPLKRLPTKAAAKVETLPMTKAVPQSASKSAGKAATKDKPARQIAANVKSVSKGRVQAPVKAAPVATSRKGTGGAIPKTAGSTGTSKAAPAVVAATVTATLKTLAEKFGEKHTLPKKQAAAMVADLFDMVLTHIRSGDRVKIAGLGVIEVKDRPARMGRNPATGEAVQVKASKKVVFRVAKDLKQAI